MQMQLEPRRWYSWDYAVMSGDRTVAQIDLSAWRERAEIMIGDVTHRVFRESLDYETGRMHRRESGDSGR